MASRRSIFLINKRFQLRFSFYVCSWIFVLSLVYPVGIVGFFNKLIGVADFYQALDVKEYLESVKHPVFWRLIFFHALFMGFIFLLSLFVSHKIAGPLYKLGQFFEEAKTGKLNPNLTFRKADHFTELAESYNEMMGELKSRVNLNSDAIEACLVEMEELISSVSGADREKLEKSISVLREVREQLAS